MSVKATKYPWFLNALKEHNSDECLLWPFAKDGHGYGFVCFEGRDRRTHRLAFFLTHGHWPTPTGRHSCDTPSCFNPRHVFEGTQAQNVADMDAKGRRGRSVGDRNSQSKLTEEQVRQIRTEYKFGERNGVVRLAKKFNVTPQAIYGITERRNWKHIA